MACPYKPLSGFYTTLEASISSNTKYLPLKDNDALDDLLPDDGDWTVLALLDGSMLELVKVENYCGTRRFVRGFEDTTPRAFPCFARAEHMMTKAGVEALACCEEFFEGCQ